MDQSAGMLGQSSKDDKTHILIYVLTQYIFVIVGVLVGLAMFDFTILVNYIKI